MRNLDISNSGIFYPEILESNDLLKVLNELTKSERITEFNNQDIKNQFYWSYPWRKLSRSVLDRDKECLVCKAYGRVTVDKLLVHHIYPIEFYPEERMNQLNLITVCQSCHNTIHFGLNDKRWDDEWW